MCELNRAAEYFYFTGYRFAYWGEARLCWAGTGRM